MYPTSATGPPNPNGKTLPHWNSFKQGQSPMILGEKATPAPDAQRIAFYGAAYAKQ